MIRGVAVGFLALLAPLTAHADAFGIEVLSATCSTTITLQSPSVTTSTTGCGVSQTMDYAAGTDPFLDASAHAFASADYFAASTSSHSQRVRIDERADSLLTFSPVTDGTALLGIDYSNAFFSSLAISLFDLTSQQFVWEQQWAYGGTGFGSFGFLGFGGFVQVPTAFSASHDYALQLHTDSNSAGDSTSASLRVSGLVAVPEPSSLLLLSTGLAGVGVFRRAQTRRSRSPIA